MILKALERALLLLGSALAVGCLLASTEARFFSQLPVPPAASTAGRLLPGEDPPNALEALREATLDIGEGADMVMVKPALPYLDVVRRVRDAVQVPVGAYQVSGEYAMVEAAAERGWIDRERVVMETLLSIRRAGVDFVLTYWAAEASRLLR